MPFHRRRGSMGRGKRLAKSSKPVISSVGVGVLGVEKLFVPAAPTAPPQETGAATAEAGSSASASGSSATPSSTGSTSKSGHRALLRCHADGRVTIEEQAVDGQVKVCDLSASIIGHSLGGIAKDPSVSKKMTEMIKAVQEKMNTTTPKYLREFSDLSFDVELIENTLSVNGDPKMVEAINDHLDKVLVKTVNIIAKTGREMCEEARKAELESSDDSVDDSGSSQPDEPCKLHANGYAVSISSCESSEDLSNILVKTELPCKRCRLSHCSNCLSRFKEGDKLVKEVPSLAKNPDGDPLMIPLEVAIARVFSRESPYPRWVNRKERDYNIIVGNDPKAVEAFEKYEDFLNEEVERLFNWVAFHKPDPPNWGDYMQEKVGEVEIPESIPDHQLMRGVLYKLVMTKYDDERLKRIDMLIADKGPRGKEVLLKQAKLHNGIPVNGYEVSAFQLCVGCGQLLTLLYSCWECWRLRRYSEEEYFEAVIVGFQMAPKAMELLLRPKEDSTLAAVGEYSKATHPHGCGHRVNTQGKSFNVGRRGNEAMKRAVGCFHAHLRESYKRVYVGVLQSWKDVNDSDSSQWEESDSVSSESEESPSESQKDPTQDLPDLSKLNLEDVLEEVYDEIEDTHGS